MKVRLLTSIAGADVAYDYGQVVEVSEVVARAWVAGGLAVALEAPAPAAPGVPDRTAPIETATVTPPEDASVRRKKGRPWR